MRHLLVVWIAVVVAPEPGLAQPPPKPSGDREAGQAAFRVGVQAFRANRFGVAAQAFEEAFEADPRPETAFSIAQANRLQYYKDRSPWRVQRALQLYQHYLAELPTGPRVRDALDRIGELEPILAEHRRRGELLPYVAPVTTQLVIGAENVETAVVTIDGATAQLWEPADVTAGSHEIVVAAEGYEPAKRRVVIAAGRFLPVDIVLRPKPGILTVRGEAGATVYVDGRSLGELPVEPAALPPGEHFVSVTRRGRVAWNELVTLDRAAAVTVDAALAPSGQRRAAWWVLGSGLAVGAASGVTALWSYAARRDAEALDEKRRALMATPADLARYNERVDDARLRSNVALGLGIGALAIGVVGASLWWFDTPDPGARPRIGVQPAIGRDELGVIVGGRF